MTVDGEKTKSPSEYCTGDCPVVAPRTGRGSGGGGGGPEGGLGLHGGRDLTTLGCGVSGSTGEVGRGGGGDDKDPGDRGRVVSPSVSLIGYSSRPDGTSTTTWVRWGRGWTC